MRTFSLALLETTPPASALRAEPAHEHDHWWNAIFRAWPHEAAPPRVERVTEVELAARAAQPRGVPFDAVVLRMTDQAQEDAVCRVMDLLQQAQVPALLLVGDEPRKMDAFHPGAALVRPLSADPDQTAAMLYALASRQTAVRGMEQNLRLAQSFHGETSAEIDRLHQELLLAARVQRDFMPKHMPEVEGFEAGVLFRPAGFVSGDTFDVYRLDDHHVGFLIADAMGHGVPAALMTLYISGSLPRKEACGNGYRIVPPGEALTRLNNSLQECLAGPARFVTAICGVVDTRTGRVDIACAGHPAPLRVGPHGARAVEVSGMLLGVVNDYHYEQVTIMLEDDELLVMHSDGIEAAFAPRSGVHADTQGHLPPPYLPHLAAMGRGDACRDVDLAIRRLSTVIDAQSGSLHQDDDLTVLVLRAIPLGKRPPAPSRDACQAETV